MATEQLLQAIAVTAELTATQLSTAAARVMADDLSRYPENQVMAALTRCRREVRSRLTIADVISRLEDGRPGVEEAWAHVVPALGDESVTLVWTEEEKRAFFIAAPLARDPIAARMAFKEAYSKAVQTARDKGEPVKWSPCLGHNAAARESALLEARQLGRLSAPHVATLLPHLEPVPAAILALVKK